MAADKTFTVSIFSETSVLYYGKCEVLFVPTERDVIAILRNHTPTIAKLGTGDVIIHTGNQKQTVTSIKSGLLYVGDNEATVLINL